MAQQKEDELKLQEQEQEQETPVTSEEQTTPITTGETPTTTGEESSSTSQEESTVKTRTPITSTPIEAPQLKNNYEKYWQEYKNVNPFDEEEYNKRKRRARSAMILESAMKGLASISNIVNASKGKGKAPGTKVAPVYEGLKSKPYYDAIEKERQTNYEAWRKGAENAAKLGAKYDKDNADLWLKTQKYNQDAETKAQIAEAEQKRKDAESGAKVKKTEGETENAAKVAESVVNKNNAGAAKARAEAEKAVAQGQAAMIRANKPTSSGSGGKVYALQTPAGTLTYGSIEEYNQAVEALTQAFPNRVRQKKNLTTISQSGKSVRKTTTTKEVSTSTKERAGDIANIPIDEWNEYFGNTTSTPQANSQTTKKKRLYKPKN